MWIMRLNDMRFPKIEILKTVAKARSKEELKALLDRERVEPYRDGQWGKVFRQGGPLEWYNGSYDHDERFHFVDIEAHMRDIEDYHCQSVEHERCLIDHILDEAPDVAKLLEDGPILDGMIVGLTKSVQKVWEDRGHY